MKQSLSIRNLCAWLMSLFVAALSFDFGYGFGLQLGGLWMGVVAGVNCAVLGVVLADAVFSRLLSTKSGGAAAD